MGIVYRATQLSLMRTVALKLLATELSDDPTFRERFRREGLLQAAIEHPHIVTVYEAGETEHGLFLAMRLVRGPTLKDEVRNGKLDDERALRILTPVADALDSAHEVGLTHRDVKPQNILIGARDHAYLADFGLTNVPDEAARLTGTGQFIGTIDYVAPEQVRGEGATSASDVYALAGVLYETLTGSVPFAKPTEAAVLYAHMSEAPPKPSERRPELPPEVDEVVARGMAKSPQERPGSASELIRLAAQAFGPGFAGAVPAAPAGGEGAPDTTPAAVQAPGGGATVASLGEATVTRDLVRPAGATAPSGAAAGATVPAAAAAGATAPARAQAGAEATAAGATAPPGGGTTAPPAARERSRGLLRVGALVLLVVAAAAGVAAGGSGSSEQDDGAPELRSSASAGNLGLSFPDGWSRLSQPEPIPGLELSDEIALAPAGGRRGQLAAGMTGASGSALLPAPLLRRLDGEPRGEPVKLGQLQALRYEGLEPEGLSERLTVFAAPTSAGVATIACVAPPRAAAAFFPDCERVAASVELTGAKPLALGPSAAYASALNAAFEPLAAAARRGSASLRAADTPAAQARAARALAGAYSDAASAVARAPAGPAERQAGARVEAALRSASAGYVRLATAAGSDDAGAYRAARATIRRSDARLQAGIDELAELGYDVA